jgi:hypothetical protein
MKTGNLLVKGAIVESVRAMQNGQHRLVSAARFGKRLAHFRVPLGRQASRRSAVTPASGPGGADRHQASHKQ